MTDPRWLDDREQRAWRGYLAMQGRQSSEEVATSACTEALRSKVQATFDAVGVGTANGEVGEAAE